MGNLLNLDCKTPMDERSKVETKSRLVEIRRTLIIKTNVLLSNTDLNIWRIFFVEYIPYCSETWETGKRNVMSSRRIMKIIWVDKDKIRIF